ncbi:MAG: purine-binding chemotaxis protein CheW [Verrucomicrobiales bacterium]|nr:purine-binding chemotaxis protein CheW [Verrucomicrobiales bacterium]
MSDNTSLTPEAPTAATVHATPCWKQVGIWGNGRCEALRQHVHCHNCPVFSAAAAELLDREMPPSYRDQWADHFGQKKADVALSTQSVLAFRLGQECFAIQMKALQEVGYLKVLRPIPHRRQGVVKGVVNVRGQLVICVSLTAALGLEPLPVTPDRPGSHGQMRLLIADHDRDRFAFPVDEIHGILRLRPGELQDLPATVGHNPSRCVSGVLSWQGKSIGLLEEGRLFDLLNRSLA